MRTDTHVCLNSIHTPFTPSLYLPPHRAIHYHCCHCLATVSSPRPILPLNPIRPNTINYPASHKDPRALKGSSEDLKPLMSMTRMYPSPPLELSLLTSALMYVCQRVFINMTLWHQLEPPCIACGSLIMSLQVPANYCLVMVIDKAINAARDCSCWSKEIPLWLLVEGVFSPLRSWSPSAICKERKQAFFLCRRGTMWCGEQCMLVHCTATETWKR